MHSRLLLKTGRPAATAVGVEGPDAREQALAFLAAWKGFVGRNTRPFTLVDVAEDLDRCLLDVACRERRVAQQGDSETT